MKERFLLIVAVSVFTLLASCPSDRIDWGNGGGNGDNVFTPPTRVQTPTISWNEEAPHIHTIRIEGITSVFSTGDPITITLDTATEGATILYAISGEPQGATNIAIHGQEYTGSFDLTVARVPTDTAHRGFIFLQFIAVKDGYLDSFFSSQTFQIFVPEPFAHSGTSTGFGVSPPGTGYYHGQHRVDIEMTNGIITVFSATNGYNDTNEDSPDYFFPAEEHAEIFLIEMNHWDFDVGTGATFTSTGLRYAARQAIESIINP